MMTVVLILDARGGEGADDSYLHPVRWQHWLLPGLSCLCASAECRSEGGWEPLIPLEAHHKVCFREAFCTFTNC